MASRTPTTRPRGAATAEVDAQPGAPPNVETDAATSATANQQGGRVPPGCTLSWQAGSVVLEGWTDPTPPHPAWVHDDRIRALRAPALAYRDVFADLHRRHERGELTLTDNARAYTSPGLRLLGDRSPRDYQTAAVAAWEQGGRNGQIVLPTGAGKSFVAHLVMARVDRATLIVVPTIDLMDQWHSSTRTAFGRDDIGLLGGGSHDIQPVTITTYDSAWIHAERYGNRFGLVIFDECHHLPGPSYQQAARAMIAPFRLGLTATPERQDGREIDNEEVIGPIVYRLGIRDLAGDFLADYDVERITVHLTEDELETYTDARQTWLAFTRSNGIRFDRPDGWARFLQLSARSREGRRAMRAYRVQRQLALTCSNKLHVVERLLDQHAGDRTIVFTNDNDTVYALSRRLLIPAITHQTPTAERRTILERFRDGTWPCVVTSRVLNEGVDVPEASVAIVLSGSGAVREHVQRLGRILRRTGDKRATLYELISSNTVEQHVSDRRREHDAYR